MKYLNKKAMLVMLAMLVHSKLQPSSEECAVTAPQYDDNNKRPYLPKRSQAIIPTYSFRCCGIVTSYRAYLQPGGASHKNSYTIRFQVWRPLMQQQYLYTLVGETLANPATLVNGDEAHVLSYNTSVQPGDVVGYFVEHNNNGKGGIQLENSNNGNNTVWYTSDLHTEVRNEQLLIGPSSTFSSTMVAPILSINISPTPCPMAVTSQHQTISTYQEENSDESNVAPIVVGVLISLLFVAVLIGSSIVLTILLIQRRKKYNSRKGIFNPYYNPKAHNEDILKSQKFKLKHDNQYEYVPLSHSAHHNGSCKDLYACTSSLQYYESSTPTDHADADEMKDRVLAPEYSNLQCKELALKSKEVENQSNEERVVSEAPGFLVPNERERRHSLYEAAMKYSKLNFFEKEEVYWVPANTSDALYDQLSSKKYREIPKKNIIILEQVSSGKFSKVKKARWNVSSTSLQIIIKQLRSNSSDEDRVQLLQEAAIMGQFWHTNVVKLYGLMTIGSPLSICLEYVINGDLRNYLLNFKINRTEPPNGLKDIKFFFVQAAKNIASGMAYLSSKAFVHRDLATRNIFLDETYACKIGNFGMSRDLMDHTYYKSTSGIGIPIRWTAPEALLYRKYSPASDVWSYGIVLYEIWSLGKRPYSNMKNQEVISLIQEGFCQSPPPGCPRAMYRLMVDCWNPIYQQRPTFEEVITYLHQPVTELLHHSADGKHYSTKITNPGAPSHNAKMMYSDLQNKYKKKIDAIYENREVFSTK